MKSAKKAKQSATATNKNYWPAGEYIERFSLCCRCARATVVRGMFMVTAQCRRAPPPTSTSVLEQLPVFARPLVSPASWTRYRGEKSEDSVREKRETSMMSVPRFTISSGSSFSEPSIHTILTLAVVEPTGAFAALVPWRREREKGRLVSAHRFFITCLCGELLSSLSSATLWATAPVSGRPS